MSAVVNLKHEPKLRAFEYAHVHHNTVLIDRRSKWGKQIPDRPRGPRGDRALPRPIFGSRIHAGEIALEELAATWTPCWLACWCDPLPCHGDVLARAAEAGRLRRSGGDGRVRDACRSHLAVAGAGISVGDAFGPGYPLQSPVAGAPYFRFYPYRLVCPTFSLLTNRLSTDVAAADYVDKCRLDGDRRHVKARSPEYGWERCGSVTRWKGSAGKAPAFPAGRSRTALSPRTRIRSGAWSAPPLFVSCVLNGCVGARPGLSCKDRSHGT